MPSPVFQVAANSNQRAKGHVLLLDGTKKGTLEVVLPDQTRLNSKQYYSDNWKSKRNINVGRAENPDWTHAKQATNVHAKACTSYLTPSLHRGLNRHKLYPKQRVLEA